MARSHSVALSSGFFSRQRFTKSQNSGEKRVGDRVGDGLYKYVEKNEGVSTCLSRGG